MTPTDPEPDPNDEQRLCLKHEIPFKYGMGINSTDGPWGPKWYCPECGPNVIYIPKGKIWSVFKGSQIKDEPEYKKWFGKKEDKIEPLDMEFSGGVKKMVDTRIEAEKTISSIMGIPKEYFDKPQHKPFEKPSRVASALWGDIGE